MKRFVSSIGALALAGIASPASADVVAASDAGFVSENEAVVQADSADVWAALIQPQNWWNGVHSWSGDAANFSLEPVAGGCFCEMLPDDGSVEHLRVVYAAPGALLRMSGALGPLQSEAITGTLTVQLEDADDGATRIRWTYVAGGYSRIPLTAAAPAVDRVMAEQLDRLVALLSTGDPESSPDENVGEM